MPDDTLILPRPLDPLDAAVRYYGTAGRLAQAIGYTPSAVTNWRLRRRIPRRAQLAIEEATGGQVTAAQLEEVYG